MAKRSYEMDMCHGPVLGKILLFSIPLMLSGMLQLLFNAADVVVVGKYAGSTALAAVGSTGSLINLLINVFIGMSVGTNVLTARYYGAKKEQDLSETVHTSMVLSLVCGGILIAIGLLFSKPLLELMGTPEDVLSQAALYMKIYFLGMPVNLLFNFGSAILRAIGDTKRPLYFLLGAGVINVCLNLIFVILLHMGVAGVALATIISQCFSAGLVFLCLLKTDSMVRVEMGKLRITKQKLIQIAKIGIPAGMQGAVFSISNVLIQSSINSFGSVAMAGSTAASNIEGFVYTAMNSFHQTAVSFTSQNLGAKQFGRISRIMVTCILLVSLVGGAMGMGAYVVGKYLLRIYSSDAEVIAYGLIRMRYVCVPYFLCGVMDTLVGGIRGLGSSIMPMIVSLLGACAFRVLWIFTIFQWKPEFHILFLSYSISWALTAGTHMVCYLIVRRKQIKYVKEYGVMSGAS